MVRKIAPALLMTVLGIAMPLAVIHAQSAATTIPREADRSWAKYKGWTDPTQERWAKLTDDDLQEIDGRREVLIGKLQTLIVGRLCSSSGACQPLLDFGRAQPTGTLPTAS
jgi:uncharacterized protein YjbJ (UPF0337 family)